MPVDISIFNKAVTAIEEGRYDVFTSLPGSSGALLFSMLRQPGLLLCRNEDAAREFHSDTVFWSDALGLEPPVLIPSRGDDLRLRNLAHVYSGKTRFVTSVEAALSPLWHIDKFPVIRLLSGSNIDRDSFIQSLKINGYAPVPVVSAHGEMSIRGGILDVFPPEEEFPVRIEFRR
ncbi:MAG: hypothetical protein HY758_01175 [Nitrospirae bacterium]|nr:hypothetical protein [Nitrospirota bacterium]